MGRKHSAVVSRDVSLNLHPGDTLRVALLVEDGRGKTLVLALGRGRGREWREDPAAGGLEVPASALPVLIRALQSLERASGVLQEGEISLQTPPNRS